jgi:hypothetical protein
VDHSKKNDFWNELTNLGLSWQCPWVIGVILMQFVIDERKIWSILIKLICRHLIVGFMSLLLKILNALIGNLLGP